MTSRSRGCVLLAAFLLVLVPAAVCAQWLENGTPIGPGYVREYPRIAPDGAGGAYITWINRAGDSNTWVQHILQSGGPAPGWDPSGRGLTNDYYNQQWYPLIVPDGAGGAYVAWSDFVTCLHSCTRYEASRLVVQKIPDPSWPGAIPVGSRYGYESDPYSYEPVPTLRNAVMVPDGQGGALLAWAENRRGVQRDILAQRVGPAGRLWGDSARVVCAADSDQVLPALVGDGVGGAIVVWVDHRDASGVLRLYGQHLSGSGDALWALDGIPLSQPREIVGRPLVVGDGAGGAIAFWPAGPADGALDLYATRVTGEGGLPWGGDVPVWAAAEDPVKLRALGLPDGGAVVTWVDGRPLYWDERLHAQRLGADGQILWAPGGVQVSGNYASRHAIAGDGGDGAWIAWGAGEVSATHLSGLGSPAPGWPVGGKQVVGPVCCWVSQVEMAADSLGGAIVVFQDQRELYGIPCEADYFRIWAIKLAGDGVVPVLASVVVADATSERARVVWQLGPDVRGPVSVQRATPTGGWSRWSSVSPDGRGRVEIEDRDVVPGERVGYRLGIPTAAGETPVGETWIEIPRGPEFGLRGVEPNPVVGPPVVRLALPDGSPARVEVTDPQGRLVCAQEVGALGAGEHSVRLDASPPLAAGIYFVRLRQGPRTATRRMIVLE